MPRPVTIEDFIPHREPIHLAEMRAALADLDPSNAPLGLSIPLPYTQRAHGAVDTIEIGPYGRTDDWVVYFGRDYIGGSGWANITTTVARCPGYMVVLVVRALHAHLTAVGPQGRTETVEGDILYALGLVRPIDTSEV